MSIRAHSIFTVFVLSCLFTACKDTSTNVTISKPQVTVGQTITSDTLSGSIKGTMISGHTYYFNSDITINKGDTLLMQSGVQLIALPNPALTATPELYVFGTFYSLGTKDKPNWIAGPVAARTYDNVFNSLWGGIQCDTGCGDVVIKWTHLESVGGKSGQGDKIYGVAGKTRYGIYFQSINHNFILEDSWCRGSVNDFIRTLGAHIAIMRNTFEFNGQVGGESINVKSGTLGDIAYNVFIGTSTNGPRLSNNGGTAVQTNVNIYNNTMVNVGWRMIQSGRSGSSDIEEGARGVFYNNLIVNCRTGWRVVGNPAAYTINTNYDNQLYYAQADSIRMKFYPSDGVQHTGTHDIAGAARANDPKFVNYNVNQFDFTQPTFTWPIPFANEPYAMNEQGSFDFHLASGSPAIGKGFTAFAPLSRVTAIGGDFGAMITAPGKDIGAYQTDSSGNQH